MWKCAAARVTGTSHVRFNAPCQDQLSWWLDEDSVFVAMSDGAGSASHSVIGAEIAVSTAIAAMRDGFRTADNKAESIRVAAVTAQTAVLERALALQLPPRALASTLLLLGISSAGGAALQIGDGVIALHDADGGSWDWVVWPQKGEYANSTHFLTDSTAEEAFEVVELPRGDVDVCMMTDGLEALALNFASKSVHERFFEGLLSPLRSAPGSGEVRSISDQLDTLLRSPRVSERTDDDLTLFMATTQNR